MDRKGLVTPFAALRLPLAGQPRRGRAPRGPMLKRRPRLGERLERYNPREVRRILVGHYEMRYEIQGSTIYVTRLWHTREDR